MPTRPRKAGLKNNAMMIGRRFHFRPVLTVFAALGLGLALALGNWQLERLQWKQDLIEKVEMRTGAAPARFEAVLGQAEAGESMEYAPVRVEGGFAGGEPARVFGAIEGAPGYFLFAPFDTDEGVRVYVNLGFTPQVAPASDMALPPQGAPVIVEGLFREAEEPSPPASWIVSAEQSSDGFWFVRDPRLFMPHTDGNALPYYIDRFAVDGAEWPKGGTTRLEFSNRHLEYALTWFGLGATLIGVWLAFSFAKLSGKE